MRHLGKIVEFEKVYLEYPNELEEEQKEIDKQEEEDIKEAEEEYQDMILSRTQKYSLEELQKKLEETQSLHL